MLETKCEDLRYGQNTNHQREEIRQCQQLREAAAPAQQRGRREAQAAPLRADHAPVLRSRSVVRIGMHQRASLRKQQHQREQCQPELAA